MFNICFKVTIEKKWRTQDFDILSLKSSSPGQFLGSSNSSRYYWIFELFVATQESEVWEQNCVWFFSYFYFERNYDVLKPKRPCFLLNKNIIFHKNETESKKQIPHTVLERSDLCFNLYKNCELKVKLWLAGAREIEKSAFFVTFILSEGYFLSICVLSQYILYWIHF